METLIICDYKNILHLSVLETMNQPVECDGAETQHGDGAKEFMEELDDLADHQRVKPPAATRAGPQRHIEGNAHQACTDPWTRQVLDEAIGHRFKDIRAAGAPQHCGVTCGEKRWKSLE